MLPCFIPQVEITHVKQAGGAFVPGVNRYLLPPESRLHKVDVHAAEHPGRMVDMEGIVAESQLLGGPIGNFLGQVHKCGGPELQLAVRLVARDGNILSEFVSFSTNRLHFTLLI